MNELDQLFADGWRPEGVRVITSYDCPRNCKFCYQPQRSSVLLRAGKLQEHLKGMKVHGFVPVYFTFQGGEISTHPDHALQLFSVADRAFPQVFRKSLTTNGYGDWGFYHKAKIYGITHITLSMHGSNTHVADKAMTLARSGFYTVRLNCFLHRDHLEDARRVYLFCRGTGIQLTLCEDLRKDCIAPPTKEEIEEHVLQDEADNYVRHRYKHQDVWVDPVHNFRFWVYHHLDHYDYDNLIILPDGTLTKTFDDVMLCAGAGEPNAA